MSSSSSCEKTNALALAVAVIIGAAIGKVVTSVVNDLLMPVVGLWLGGGDWRAWQIALKTAPDGKVLSAIGVGSFLGALVDFVIIAFFVFLDRKDAPEGAGTCRRPRHEDLRRLRRERPRQGHALQVLHERR